MADRLSIIASIPGIVAIGVGVVSPLYRTISDALESARLLHIELQATCQVLSTLAAYVTAGSTIPPCLQDIVTQLNIDIQAVDKLIASHQDRQPRAIRLGIKQAIWVIQSVEINAIRDRIGRYQPLLAIALTLATKSVPLP